jgi:hypothetical protein
VADEIWVVRAGEKARYADDFRNGSFVAVGFEEFFAGDLTKVSEQALRAQAANPAERTYASQLSALAYRIDNNDYVIVPLLPRQRSYLVGRVEGVYQHVDPPPRSGPHRRSVRWLGEFPREDLSESATNTLGAIQTVFRPTAIEAELRSFLTRLSPAGSPAATEPESLSSHRGTFAGGDAITDTGLPAQLDVTVDRNGRAHIVCAHPALEMEQTPRHLDPSAKWVGVAGIYVLTGTELDHAAVRTGQERTLTTTLIVRPWAYVGLSEDFTGRLTSHRQTKPEWRRALLVRSGAVPFSSDDIKYLERKVHNLLTATGEVQLDQAIPRGNLSAQPRNPALLDACANTIVAVLRLTGTLI